MQSLRGFVLLIYVINLLLYLGIAASIPNAWIGILPALCGVLLAYYVWEDGKKIEWLEATMMHASPEFCCGKCPFFRTKECERKEENYNMVPCEKFYTSRTSKNSKDS